MKTSELQATTADPAAWRDAVQQGKGSLAQAAEAAQSRYAGVVSHRATRHGDGTPVIDPAGA